MSAAERPLRRQPFGALRTTSRARRIAVASFGAMLLGTVAGAGAAPNILRWIPSDTRVVFEIDPRDAPRSRDALGLEPLLDRLAARRLPASERQHQTVAYIPEGTVANPVVFTVGTRAMGKSFERVRGAKLETIGGKALHAAGASTDWAVALVEPECMIEGPRQTVRAVLDHSTRSGTTLADLPIDQTARRLLAVSTAPRTAVSLLYFAPGTGKDVYAVLQDLDRTLGVGLSAAVASYQSALRVLGTTRGLRLDLTENPEEVATTLRLAMPSNMAANMASVSLQAGKDMGRMASDAAVEAGKMTQADALILAAALETMQTQVEEDIVLVRLRIADNAPPQGAH